jgi:hypothetical protein
MAQIIKLKTTRDFYNMEDCAENSLSVDELIDMLSTYPPTAKVVFSNDNDYTFGAITKDTFKRVLIKVK